MYFIAGEHIGPYQLLEKIGEGGMGTVFKAYHPALDRHVALKIIHLAHREDPSFVARFQREARLVAKLEHANIVPIYDYAEFDKTDYLVMKFIEGSTLKDRLTRGSLSFYETLQVVDSVGAALAYAHIQGVLHRDIKPSNVLIGNNGVMYLADFGLARIAQAEASTLSSESALGTPHYVSPEQALGRNNLDQRTDIYSFGIMLYEMVVGQAPFNANGAFAIIHDHIYTPLPLPRSMNPNVPEAIESVLLKALAKDPNDRFENVIQLVTAFRNAWLNSNGLTQSGALPSPVTSMPVYSVTSGVSLPTMKESEPKKKKLPVWLYFSIGTLLLIGAAFALLPTLRANLLSTPTAMPTSSITFTLTPTIGLTTSPIASPGANNNNSTADPNANNTPAPQPTDQPTSRPTTQPTAQPTQPPNLITPIVEPIQTIIGDILTLPPLFP